ncbi:TlpA family protein disulfide reductase [Piscinibacter aquaticus]|uniref:TlpA family protein disulfide reductase n=1 Tax=Piscinibacter aquaticus TaxID=392597 RepID=A0A5C6U082_9BURK|nr:TlpA family protein disulfide reductase [Piscinibacter aquaticus]
MKATRRTLIAALAACAAGVRAAPAAPGEAVRWPEVMMLLDGERWTPAPGRAQVVVFWSVTCPFCKRHNAHVDKLHRASASGGPQVLTVSRDRDAAAVQRYLAANGYSFPVTLANEAMSAALVARRIIPLTVLIDRQGRLKQAIPGEMFEEDVMELTKLA